MKNIAWLTDIHLDFLDDTATMQFISGIARMSPHAVCISGDISSAGSLERHLYMINKRLKCPIYFVLGNHDFYGGSITGVRSLVRGIAEKSRRLKWLTRFGIAELTGKTCLIGHDGWADGRLGNGSRSQVSLNDYHVINDFIGLSQTDRFRLLNTLGDQAAAYFRNILPDALERFSDILLLIHVPPFKESCWHEGRIANDEWLPHFSCLAAGNVIKETMKEHPDKHLTILCGHTHSSGIAEIAPNITVKTGRAVYGKPEVQEIITVE